MEKGEVPETWKIGHVAPIFKKGKTCDPSISPISLTSNVCKTMESLVRHEPMQHLLTNELFYVMTWVHDRKIMYNTVVGGVRHLVSVVR